MIWLCQPKATSQRYSWEGQNRFDLAQQSEARSIMSQFADPTLQPTLTAFAIHP